MNVKRLKTPMLTAVLLGVSLGLSGCPGEGDIVLFSDPNLEAAVRAELRIHFGLMREGDLLQLFVLDARNAAVTDLAGLESATNLTSLDLGNDGVPTQAITDLTPIARLVKLNFLNLENNTIANITPISGLFNLDQLYLAGNNVFNITPLVANSESGGLGGGDTVTLSRAPLVDEDGELSGTIQEDVSRLLANGVDVVLID